MPSAQVCSWHIKVVTTVYVAFLPSSGVLPQDFKRFYIEDVFDMCVTIRLYDSDFSPRKGYAAENLFCHGFMAHVKKAVME